MVYGYCRVSTKDQNLDRQIIAMKCHDITPENMFCDMMSGKDFNRPEWKRLQRKLKPGDVLYLKSIDRLGRNYDEIRKTWQGIIEKDVGIVVIDMPVLNTANDRDLTGRLIADIVLQLLAYVAETERTFIKERQREGIEAAKARGVRFGREPGPRPEGWRETLERVRSGELSMRKAAVLLNVPRTSLYYWLPELTAEGGTADAMAEGKTKRPDTGKIDTGTGRRDPDPVR